MRKNGTFRSILTIVMALSLSLFLASCGGGGGDGGSTAGSSGSITLAVSNASIPADGSSSVTIRALVTDSAGNPVRHYTDVTFTTNLGRFRNGGKTYTVQTQPPLDADGWPDREAAPTGVVDTAFIAGTKAGAAKVTVQSNNATQTVYITITGSGAAISLVASPDSIPADGTSSTTITATVVNSTGTPVTPGTEIAFRTGLGYFQNGLKTYSVQTTDAAGVVEVSLIAGVVPGTTYIEANSADVTQALSIVMTKTDPLYCEITVEGQSFSNCRRWEIPIGYHRNGNPGPEMSPK